jgi:hypothetical protein
LSSKVFSSCSRFSCCKADTRSAACEALRASSTRCWSTLRPSILCCSAQFAVSSSCTRCVMSDTDFSAAVHRVRQRALSLSVCSLANHKQPMRSTNEYRQRRDIKNKIRKRRNRENKAENTYLRACASFSAVWSELVKVSFHMTASLSSFRNPSIVICKFLKKNNLYGMSYYFNIRARISRIHIVRILLL